MSPTMPRIAFSSACGTSRRPPARGNCRPRSTCRDGAGDALVRNLPPTSSSRKSRAPGFDGGNRNDAAAVVALQERRGRIAAHVLVQRHRVGAEAVEGFDRVLHCPRYCRCRHAWRRGSPASSVVLRRYARSAAAARLLAVVVRGEVGDPGRTRRRTPRVASAMSRRTRTSHRRRRRRCRELRRIRVEPDADQRNRICRQRLREFRRRSSVLRFCREPPLSATADR